MGIHFQIKFPRIVGSSQVPLKATIHRKRYDADYSRMKKREREVYIYQ